jgi:guanine deaminase
MNVDDAMRRVLELADRAAVTGEGLPYGAVVLLGDDPIGEAHNEVLATRDPTAHAELLAIRRAGIRLGRADLSGCRLVTNVAPCCMCMAGALWARVDSIHYALGMEASDAIGAGDAHLYDELARPIDQRRLVPLERMPVFADAALRVMVRAPA